MQVQSCQDPKRLAVSSNVTWPGELKNGGFDMKSACRGLIFGAAILATTSLPGVHSAVARDLTVVSWGGNFQDAQREIFFKPFSATTGKPVLDEAWDGG